MRSQSDFPESEEFSYFDETSNFDLYNGKSPQINNLNAAYPKSPDLKMPDMSNIKPADVKRSSLSENDFSNVKN